MRKFHDRFGTAGVVIAVIALIAALGGTALAASGKLNGKQKKEVKKIAMQYAGKPGAPGATGPAGSAGTNGTAGANGKSVIAKSEPKGVNCEEGGSSFEVEGSPTKHYACNGSPWTAGGTLPSEKTETGTWAFNAPFNSEETGLYPEPISFPIPLTEPIATANTHLIVEGEEFVEYEETAPNVFVTIKQPSTACHGNVENPTAVKGNFCLYAATLTAKFLSIGLDWKSGVIALFVPNAAESFSTLGFGTWAVTAQ